MQKSVVVLQSSDEEALECAERLSRNFEVVGYTADSEVALNFIAKEKPDFVVLSLTLKRSDGITVIRKTKEISSKTKCIVVSVLSSVEYVQGAIDAGACYYMIKPIDYNALIERMEGMSASVTVKPHNLPRDKGNKNIEEKISRIFIGMGIPPHIKGYGYLREGVKLAVVKPEIINSITKKLYPTIGEKFGTSASKVERAIRHAIEVAWNKGRIESFNALFGVKIYSENEKPTNSEFIALIADRLLLDEISQF